MHLLSKIQYILAAFLTVLMLFASANGALAVGYAGPVTSVKSYNSSKGHVPSSSYYGGRQTVQGRGNPGERGSPGNGIAGQSINQTKATQEGQQVIGWTNTWQAPMPPTDVAWKDDNTGTQWKGKLPYHARHDKQTSRPASGTWAALMDPVSMATPFEGRGKIPTANGSPQAGSGAAMVKAAAEHGRAVMSNFPELGIHAGRHNNTQQQASRASSAGECALDNYACAFDAYMQFLVNVANEDAGAACSSEAASKTYANVAWMTMQMYKYCYIPMAILLLLPGAIITNTKSMISFGILFHGRDDDVQSPFVGIFRSIIAIFLIPATQLAVSYCVDIGNSLEASCQDYISIPLIELWAQQQVQILTPDQQGNPIPNLPVVPQAPYRGKFAAMPQSGAVMEAMSSLDTALAELANEMFHMLTFGMDILNAFQLALICYLFLLGPLAAAFFAWPMVARDLFRNVFSSWLDAVVIVSLWKFWWNITLICMTVRLESGGVDPYSPVEVYYLVAFFAVLLTVPFNPFDFRAGQIVGFILSKAEGVAGKVAQGGKSQGGGKTPKAHGGHHSPHPA